MLVKIYAIEFSNLTKSEKIIVKLFKKYATLNFNEIKKALFIPYVIIGHYPYTNEEIRQYYPILEAVSETTYWLKQLVKNGYLINRKLEHTAISEPHSFYYLSYKAFNRFNYSDYWLNYQLYMKKVNEFLC